MQSVLIGRKCAALRLVLLRKYKSHMHAVDAHRSTVLIYLYWFEPAALRTPIHGGLCLCFCDSPIYNSNYCFSAGGLCFATFFQGLKLIQMISLGMQFASQQLTPDFSLLPHTDGRSAFVCPTIFR